ncbi:MAG: hypothetical protein ACJASX_002499 [Limisphaerales bacterium]|jgi:hypothetical protein
MNLDISYLLDDWDYQPGQLAVRKFTGKDDCEKIQMRLDLGILQMNADGRPDGKRPMGHESWYEAQLQRLETHMTANEGEEENFVLQGQDVSRLQQEAIQYHHRYICFYQLNEFDQVVRDAERNLNVFDFVDKFAESEELSWSVQQFRPQLIMMLIRAEGSLALESEKRDEAADVIQEGIEALREFYTDFDRPDLLENSGEINSLETWLEEIESGSDMEDGVPTKPSPSGLTEIERLERALKDAIVQEDYERAAEVRDILAKLKAT